LGAAGSCHVQGYDCCMIERPSRHASRLGVGLGIAIVFAACSPGAPPSSSGASAAPASPELSNATAAVQAEQTDTDWGRIWDGLPEAFPVFPGATPADDAASEVASATFALEGADARGVAGWMQTELERAMYATESLNGPLEDGSFVLESTGPSDCRIQVAIAPLGGLMTVSVRYGAACPAP
jgi:hypothetical protein